MLAWSSLSPERILRYDGVVARDSLLPGVYRFREQAEAELEVHVADSRGVGSKALLRLERELGSERQTVARRSTSPDGLANFRVRDSGPYHVVIEELGSRSAQPFPLLTQHVGLDAKLRAIVNFVIEPASSLTVRVRNSGGAPVAGALVVLRYTDRGLVRSHPESGPAGELGVREFGGIEPGSAIVQVSGTGLVPQWRSITLDAGVGSQLNVEMVEGGAHIRGRLRLGDGSMTPRIGSVFLLRRGIANRDTMGLWTLRMDSDGEFAADGLSAGSYDAHFSIGSSTVVVRLEIATDDASVDLGVLDVAPALSVGTTAITATIRTDHRGVRSVELLIQERSWPSWLFLAASVRADPNARQEIRLPTGRYVVTISPAGVDGERFDLSGRSEVVVDGTAQADPVVIEMPTRP